MSKEREPPHSQTASTLQTDALQHEEPAQLLEEQPSIQAPRIAWPNTPELQLWTRQIFLL